MRLISLKSGLIFSILCAQIAQTAPHSMSFTSLKPGRAPKWFQSLHTVKTLKAQEQASSSQDRPFEMNPRDLAHQRGIQRLIDRGIITDGTLVLSDTGHDIPMAATLAQNQKAHFAFHFPDSLQKSSSIIFRLKQQIHFFGDAFQSRQISPSAASVYFLGLEFHRENFGNPYHELGVNQLPSEQDLKAAGIKRIVYLYEYALTADPKDFVSSDIMRFKKTLNSIPFKTYAVDCQRINDCDSYIRYTFND